MGKPNNFRSRHAVRNLTVKNFQNWMYPLQKLRYPAWFITLISNKDSERFNSWPENEEHIEQEIYWET